MKSKFDVVYKDFKTAAVLKAAQVAPRALKRTTAGFETFSMLLRPASWFTFLTLP